MATKAVLLFGALALGFLLLLQTPAVMVLYLRPGAPPNVAPFTGLGPAVRFWFGLLAVALARDYVVSRRDRNVVQPFATVLKDDSVRQVPDGSMLSTTTSGILSDRMATVTFRDAAGSRTPPVLQVNVACNCPWVLELRRRSIVATLMGLAGAVVETGDPELDASIVVQADDDKAVRRWLQKATVRTCLLSLFQQHKVDAISMCEEGTVLRAEFVRQNPITQPKGDATAVTQALGALAQSLERD